MASVLFFVLCICSPLFSTVIAGEGTYETIPKVTHQMWSFTGQGSKQEGEIYIEVDSYQVSNANDAVVNPNNLLRWAVNQMRRSGSRNGYPVYLDITVTEEKTVRKNPYASKSEVGVRNGDQTGTSNNRRGILMFLLVVTCISSWTLFCLQACAVARRCRRRKQWKLKAAAKKALNEIKVPLLSQEGTMK